jgi:hypothetical protein
VNEHEQTIERLNQMLRSTGYGQGQIDAYAEQCESTERWESIARKLEDALRALSSMKLGGKPCFCGAGRPKDWRRHQHTQNCARCRAILHRIHLS